MANSFAQSYFKALFGMALEEKGFSVSGSGRYIIAEKEGKVYAIQKSCRKLSKGIKAKETGIGKVKTNQVKKLLEYCKENKYIPAIAYGICKYDYSKSEIIIIPVHLWDIDDVSKCLSKTNTGYYYNYKHIYSDDMALALKGILARAVIDVYYDKRF